MPSRTLVYGSGSTRAAKHWLPEFVLLSACLLTLFIGFSG